MQSGLVLAWAIISIGVIALLLILLHLDKKERQRIASEARKSWTEFERQMQDVE